MSRSFLHESGVFFHCWVILGTSCHGCGFKYVDSTLVDDCVQSMCLEEACYLGDKLVVAEQSFPMCFGGFSSFKLLLNVLVNRLSKNGCPHLVKDFMFYGVVQHSKDSPLSTKGGCVADLPNSFFPHVRNCRQRLCDPKLDFIGDHHL